MMPSSPKLSSKRIRSSLSASYSTGANINSWPENSKLGRCSSNLAQKKESKSRAGHSALLSEG
jgi:hypothetical protein